MSVVNPKPLRGSLIERAADLYDFGLIALPPLPAEAPVQDRAPAAEPAPVAAPAAAPARKAPTRPAVPLDRALLAEGGLIVPGAPVGALAEEFRLIKRQLLLTARAIEREDGARARLMLVCSANPDEGKTYCALNLALSMAAEPDLRVLLVDADFAKPDVLARLGIEPGRGLLDVLADPRLTAEDCIVETDIANLAILPAGSRRTNDTELLASERTEVVLAELLEADPRRVIIFDSPPALAASPASVLALHAGQVMLVVRADRTSENDVKQAVQLLDGCEHIQLVLNAVSFNPGGHRFGSYYGQETGK